MDKKLRQRSIINTEIKLIEFAEKPALYSNQPNGKDKGLKINRQQTGSEFFLVSLSKSLN